MIRADTAACSPEHGAGVLPFLVVEGTMGAFNDITGQSFGLWFVLGIDPKTTGHTRYLARCACGTVRSVDGNTLRAGKSGSCGCAIRKGEGVAARNSIYRNYKRGALTRGLVFELNTEDFAVLTKKDCFYCGAAPAQTHKNLERYMGSYVYNGLDRVRPTEGYTRANTVPCCGVCNFMKRTMSYEEFISRCQRIAMLAARRLVSP